MSKHPPPLWARCLILVLVAVITLGLAFLDENFGLPLQDHDKQLHIAAFVAITVLATWALRPERPILLFIPLLALGGLTELAQFAPGISRTPDWLDFGFNIIAIATTLAVIMAARRLKRS